MNSKPHHVSIVVTIYSGEKIDSNINGAFSLRNIVEKTIHPAFTTIISCGHRKAHRCNDPILENIREMKTNKGVHPNFFYQIHLKAATMLCAGGHCPGTIASYERLTFVGAYNKMHKPH